MTTLPTFIAIYVVLTLLATSFMGARFHAKRMKRLSYSPDDSLLLLALANMYFFLAGSVVAVTLGRAGDHISDLTSAQLEATLLLIWILQFPYAVAMLMVRWSICIFFNRTFFTKFFSKLRCIVYGCIVLSCCWFLGFMLVAVLHCRPIHFNWSDGIESPKHCFALKPYTIAQASCGLAMDAVIWSLPHFVVWKLQLRYAHKIVITFIFALGSLNIFVAVFRITSLFRVKYQGDVTFDIFPAIAWAYTQISTAIMLNCCPLLRPVFEKLIPRSLTRIGTPARTTNQLQSSRGQAPAIRVTTRIDVYDDSSLSPSTSISLSPYNGNVEPYYGPVFEVQPSPTVTP